MAHQPPPLELYNTLTRKKERFCSRDDRRVKMFTCGPSIYSRPHIGNYRTFLFEDVLQRYLEYLGYRVARVLNFTDVEDKALAEAARRDLTLEDLTQPIAERFFEEARQLRLKLPEVIPRSSTCVAESVRLIQILLEKGYAYWHGGDVFFDPLRFEGFGKLYGLDLSRWPQQKRRFRKDTYPGQRWNLGDFILWHGCRQGETNTVAWDTEIGKGRPAWNIQDPAMIRKHLGEQIDISCGGVDNLFRHHDYNLAVMEASSGKKFAAYWLHGEHVLVNGVKMSKSRGNIVYPEQLLKGDLSPSHLRFFLIDGHYRQKLNLQERKLAVAARRLEELRGLVTEVESADPVPQGRGEGGPLLEKMVAGFEECLSDDLDVQGAVDHLALSLARLASHQRQQGLSREEAQRLRRDLRRFDRVLRVIYPDEEL